LAQLAIDVFDFLQLGIVTPGKRSVSGSGTKPL